MRPWAGRQGANSFLLPCLKWDSLNVCVGQNTALNGVEHLLDTEHAALHNGASQYPACCPCLPATRSYERTYPVVNYTRDDCGPVYVTIG